MQRSYSDCGPRTSRTRGRFAKRRKTLPTILEDNPSSTSLDDNFVMNKSARQNACLPRRQKSSEIDQKAALLAAVASCKTNTSRSNPLDVLSQALVGMGLLDNENTKNETESYSYQPKKPADPFFITSPSTRV